MEVPRVEILLIWVSTSLLTMLFINTGFPQSHRSEIPVR